jgi:hypothetical protein
MANEEDTWATSIKKEFQEQPRNPNRDDLDQFEQQDEFIFRNNLIYVPEGSYTPKDPEKMPRQHPSQSLRNGMDSQTSVKELLVAQDKQADMRVCQVL